MTSLDELMSILKPNCSPMTAIHITPQKILLVVSIKEFWNCLQVFNKNNVRFRFLEKRKLDLDVHLSFSIQKSPLEVTLRVIDYSSSFTQELTEKFPPAAIFIQEIEESK